jgi:hypothetical protein
MSTQQRFTALILLMVYTITGTSLVPAAMLMLATIDGSHSIQIRESDQGTQLLLHHKAGQFTPQVCDHQKTLARIIVSMCRPNTEGDHKMISAHVASSVNSERDLLLKTAVKNSPMLNYLATSSLVLWVPKPNTPSFVKGLVRDEPVFKQRQLSLATVQLLI